LPVAVRFFRCFPFLFWAAVCGEDLLLATGFVVLLRLMHVSWVVLAGKKLLAFEPPQNKRDCFGVEKWNGVRFA
jgi:hypothetical protein